MYLKIKFLLVNFIYFLLFFIHCNTTIPIKYNLTPEQSKSILGVKMSLFRVPFISHAPKGVLFVRNEEEIVKSSWIKGKNVYLFNPKKGKYTIFAAIYEDKSKLFPEANSNQYVVFPQSLSIDVGEDKGFFFMGETKVKLKREIPSDREIKSRVELFLPNIQNVQKSLRNVFIAVNNGSKNTFEIRAKFIEDSKINFMDSNWESLFENL